MMTAPRHPSGIQLRRGLQDRQRGMVRARTMIAMVIRMITPSPLLRVDCCDMKRPGQRRSCSAVHSIVHPKNVNGKRRSYRYRPVACFFLNAFGVKLLFLREIRRPSILKKYLLSAVVARMPCPASKYLPRLRLMTEMRILDSVLRRRSAIALPLSTVNSCKMTPRSISHHQLQLQLQ